MPDNEIDDREDMLTEILGDIDEYVWNRYMNAINYYWKAGKHNKRVFKFTRGLTIVLGAVVTLIASLSAGEVLKNQTVMIRILSFSTPTLAAILTIVGGFGQSFRWGPTWQEMVLTAQQLEKERDRFLVTPPPERDHKKEIDLINTFVIKETKGFFGRIFSAEKMEDE